VEPLADVRAELFAQEPGRDAFEGVDQDRQGDFGRVVDQQVDVVVLAVEFDRTAPKLSHTSIMMSSQRRRISSVNTLRRYLGVKTKWAWRL
jgi:propanediol dehydratase large subunit